MEWWLSLLIIFGALLALMAIGLPLAVCFMLVVLVGGFLLMGGERGLAQVTLSIFGSVAHFTLLPLPLFILMGEVMYQSGIAPDMMKSLDIWLGRLPGRLSLLAVGSGTMLSFLTGASMASVAILGSTLVPEMQKRGYKSSMTLGPILGSGGLAVMIPPSAIAILFGVIAEVSIGRILMAIIIPGLIMAILYAAYVIIRCSLQPHLAPAYDMPHIPIKQKILQTLKHIVPLSVIIFLVTGVILLGIATPTEAAATGALGTFIVVAAYRRLTWDVVKKAVTRSTSITVMIFMIILGAKAFGQIVAFSGASKGLVEAFQMLPVSEIFVFIIMLCTAIFLGMFLTTSAVMMTLIPLFMPAVYALGFDPIWFGAVFIIAIETGFTTPPYGANLFVMKGVVADAKIGDIYRAALPFLRRMYAGLSGRCN